MRKIDADVMKNVQGGYDRDTLGYFAGSACVLMIAGAAVPVVGWMVSAAIFGPTCAGGAFGYYLG